MRRQGKAETKKVGHALFECPRNAKNEEEGEKRVLMAFGPQIGRFG